jgi:hypothetical protein
VRGEGEGYPAVPTLPERPGREPERPGMEMDSGLGAAVGFGEGFGEGRGSARVGGEIRRRVMRAAAALRIVDGGGERCIVSSVCVLLPCVAVVLRGDAGYRVSSLADDKRKARKTGE